MLLSCRVLIISALLATIISTLRVYPHQLAYFNELAGGPSNGHRHLLGSNLDWGQGLLEFRDWFKNHPDRRPVHLAYYGFFDPADIGLGETERIVQGPVPRPLPPGWYAISTNYVHGLGWFAYDGAEGRTRYDESLMRTFAQTRPVTSFGYAIQLFYLGPPRGQP